MGFLCFLKRNFRFFLRSFFQFFVAIPITLLYCYRKMPKQDTLNIVICNHIGDFLFTMGYLEEYKEKKNVGNIYIYGHSKFSTLVKMYDNLNCTYVSLSNFFLEMILMAYNCRFGQILLNYFGCILFVEPANIFQMGFDKIKCFPGITLKDCIKYGVFGLSKESIYVLPKISYEKIENDVEKKVILCPETQVIDIFNTEDFIIKLGEFFYDSGYEVYINTLVKDKYNQEKICVVDWSLEEFLFEAKNSSLVIGVRSGILDLAALTNTMVIALYPKNYDEQLVHFYDLQVTNPSNSKVYQYCLTDNHNEDFLRICNLFYQMR